MKTSVHDLLEKHFETAFAAPDGIAKLRELILTLAMRGKLVPQDPNDPPASELLKEIEAEKQRLIKEGKIRKPKPLPPIKPEEVPYELPRGWEWVRLGEIGTINPRNDAEDSATAGFVPMPLIAEGYSDKHQFEERPWGEIKKGYTHFADGDVGMAKITPCFENAKSCVFSDLPNGIGAGTTELHIFRNSFNSVAPRFLLYYLKNPNYISRTVPKMTGSAGQKRVPTPYFTQQLFPLPPLREQHRIVKRIDQLMARCDALEKLRKEQEEKRRSVHAAAIRQLLDAPNQSADSAADSAWSFLKQHFGELYSVKENVAELRKAILQLAVMGRLVPQDPNDPPASELLKEIETEKQRLIQEGKIKKPKKLPPIKPEEVPYELPQGWEWVRLGELVSKLGSGSTPRGGKSAYVNEGIPFLRSQNVWNDGLRLDDVAYIPEETHKKMEATKVAAKDILLNITGASLGRTSLVPDDFEEANVSQHVTIIRCIQPDQRRFIHFLLQSPYCQRMIWTRQVGMAREGLSKKVLELFEVPLPPLPEQHRIVKRIDQLMALCDTLEQQIDAATGKQTELLNAVMVQV